MVHNPESIPEEIFSLLETHTYTQLNPHQQNMVAVHFSEEEYDEMHGTILTMRRLSGKEKNIRKVEIRNQLLRQFDQKHQAKQVPLRAIVTPLYWWQAAAVGLLLVSATLGIMLTNRKNNHMPLTTTRTDTVYLVQETTAIPVKLVDTVYIRSTGNPPTEQKIAQLADVHKKEERSQSFPSDAIENIPVVSINEIERASNQPKKNSMQDDSLIRRYSFVTL